MLDRITITGLRVKGRHGVYEAERREGQDFVVDAVLWLDTAAAAAADDLTLTADYGAIVSRLAGIVAGEPVSLIETLADRLAAACLEHGPVREAEITVHKPEAPVSHLVADIAVTIRRSRPVTPAAGFEQAAAEVAAGAKTLVLALGSNLGDKVGNLQRGVMALCGDGIHCLRVSAIYQTEPVGGPEQDDYLNAVLLAASTLPATEILDRCMAAEAAAGRQRTVRWGPRTLDVDVICYGQEISADPRLTLPHPRARERAFVLVPWLEVAPDAWLPGNGPVASLPAAAGTAGIRRLGEPRLTLPGRNPEPKDHEVTPCS
jgi:dihydroneopterin aldolase / 2-amino-4-hydroxy-6-hydroxymethyldihydropteridine diphosphokinase